MAPWDALYRGLDDATDVDGAPATRPAPGRTSLTSRLPPRRSGPPAGAATAVQREAAAITATDDPFAIHAHATAGVAGAGAPLPHLAEIQRSFGRHDVSGVRAQVAGAATEAAGAIGARAYAVGDAVAFAATPDLRLAAHEAAHVIQQRGGVQLAGGVGAVGDPYERHADEVAELVVRGASAEAVLDRLAGDGGGRGAAVQCDPEPERRFVTAPYEIVPRELPSRAGRALQTALVAAIPADRRHDEALTILHLLPALANIVDPDITAARDRDLIVSPSSAWHPQSYASDPIALPYRYALWDYFKARWESDDLATRRRHLTAAHEHWWSLMAPRVLGQAVAHGQVGAIRTLIHQLIEQPVQHLRSDRSFEVLTHDGVALTAEERAARAASRARPRPGGGGGRGRGHAEERSETIDVAAGDVHVTDGAARTVRYINPEAIALVPHNPRLSPNPRRHAFDALAEVLQRRAQLEPADAAGLTAIDAEVQAAEVVARQRIREHLTRGRRADRDEVLARLDTLPLTTDVVVQSHDVDVGRFRVHLEPVLPGALVERPGGFRASVSDTTTGRAVVGAASGAVLDTVLADFSGAEQTIARQYLEVIRSAEGTMTSLNTWDRLGITLGSGLGAAGRLQDEFALLERDDPEAYERLFGRHGIDVHERGLTAGAHHGSGNSSFERGGATGRDATMAMADDPATLGVMVVAGIDPAWQTSLLRGAAGSIRSALGVGIGAGRDGAPALVASGGVRLFTWLSTAVSGPTLAAAMFSMADDFHGAGHLSGETAHRFAAAYAGAGGSPGAVDAAPPAVRTAIATWLVRDCSHPPRRAAIARVLGVGSFAALTGG